MKRSLASAAAVLVALVCVQAHGSSLSPNRVINDRPIVGVLTQPMDDNTSYIAASYVKFLESAGARVAPVHFDSSAAELTAVFQSINGLLIPGGGSDLSNTTTLRASGKVLYDLAVAANDNNDTFPLWGTCMGFQFLALLTAQDDSILCSKCFEAEGIPLPLTFTAAAKNSSLFGPLPGPLYTALSEQNLTENSHHDGIRPDTFKSNANLAAMYTVLSTNLDTNKSEFVSTIEAKGYPFAATQWHPEKANFEWGLKLGPTAIPHSANAVLVSQAMANFVVTQARGSAHKFSSPEEEQAALIYNDEAKPDPQGYFTQIYTWSR